MSHFGDYINEAGLLLIEENEHGFVTYHLEYPHTVINDLYIRPESRRDNYGTEFVDHVINYARSFGCVSVMAAIHMASNTRHMILAACQKRGFHIAKEAHPVIIVERFINEGEG